MTVYIVKYEDGSELRVALATPEDVAAWKAMPQVKAVTKAPKEAQPEEA